MTYPYQQNPNIVVNGVWDIPSQSLIATLPSVIFNRRLARVNIIGPNGSRCDLYQDAVAPQNRFEGTARGSSNTNDFSNAYPIPRGSIIYAVWTLGQTSSTSMSTITFGMAV